MDIVVDSLFKESYGLYYKNEHESTVLKRIDEVFSIYDPDIVMDTINIIKASSVVGMSYSECYDKIVSKILNRFPTRDNIDLFILNIVLKVMISVGSAAIKDIMTRGRDVYKEVAAKYFRMPLAKVTDDLVKRVMSASQKFDISSYSVQEKQTESWDEYYYNVCTQVARHSKCLSRRIGAVLVNDKSIISTGYNSPPRGIPKCDFRCEIDLEFIERYKILENDIEKFKGVCPRKALGFASGQGLDICIAGHAERNTLINAARNGISTKGTIMYMTCSIPCSSCLVEIINAGVKEIVVTSLQTYDKNAMYLISNSSLEVRLFDFVK